MPFLAGLDEDLEQHLLTGIKELWTYHSTAIEGNSLTLQEVHFVMIERVAVSGKPLKDHNEVVGHAKAIDLLIEMASKEHCHIGVDDIFLLHKAVQTEPVFDIMKPIGGWKTEPNGRYAYNKEKRMVFHSYTEPGDVRLLMDEWIEALNESIPQSDQVNSIELIDRYAFLHAGLTSIHPFFDGNGRMARLLCNIPLLRAGLLPLVISSENRVGYLKALQEYSENTPVPDRTTGVWPAGDYAMDALKACCQQEYAVTLDLMDQIQAEQKKRDLWRQERAASSRSNDPSQ
ncbi:Fic family protein [Marinospirillum sp. MEB164]|uniref:Fic family protein n=1 Tax=Marinospirillum alkalitolerans TaxID=3123374 RepID=A0ABW8PV05_9GAMM